MSPQSEPIVSGAASSDDPLAGEPELRKELVAKFLADCPRLLLEIRAAIAHQNGPSLKLAAHTLKGWRGIFGVRPAFDAALHMEHVGKEEDWDHAEKAWKAIFDEMDSFLITLGDQQSVKT